MPRKHVGAAYSNGQSASVRVKRATKKESGKVPALFVPKERERCVTD
jgi:hypothetical protein